MGKGILKGQLKLEDIAAEMTKKEKPSPFKLTVAEKAFVCAYFAYCNSVNKQASVAEILSVFDWGNERNARWFPAWRDWYYADDMYAGEFNYRTRAIVDLLNDK